jgi:hypothetical protein
MGIVIGVTDGKGQWAPDSPHVVLEACHQEFFGTLREFEKLCALAQLDPYGDALLNSRFYNELYNDLQRMRLAIARRELPDPPYHIELESGEREAFGWAGLDRVCKELIVIIAEAKLRNVNMIALGD